YAGSLTFSLRVGGFSLLSARMTVLDENGKVLGVASTNGEAGADTEITIQHRDRDSMYLVRVESDARAGDFAIGSYALVTTFDARNQVSPETLQEVLRLRYDFLREEESRPLLLGGQEPSFFDDLHLNDTLASATLLKSLSGFDEFQEYEATAGIADLNDVDFYQIKSPDFAAGDPGIMTVTVQATRLGGLLSNVQVFDRNGGRMDATVITNNGGTVTVQVSGIVSGKPYFIRVAGNQPRGRFATGNYRLSISFSQPKVERQELSSGTMSAATASQGFTLDIHQTQLLQLALTSRFAGDSQTAVTVSLFDTQGNLRQRIVGLAGDVRTGQTLLLEKGTYFVHVSTTSYDGSSAAGLEWEVAGTTLSDPAEIILTDPTQEPPPPDGTITDPLTVSSWPADYDLMMDTTLLSDPWQEIPPEMIDSSYYAPLMETFQYDPVMDPNYYDMMMDPLMMWYWV
ncbi:MAG: hypothetical protein KDA96_22560, partial [Planctomycetaceae bacterium]|nr:hypothetical protein [Planctomycetaceae bacterium]